MISFNFKKSILCIVICSFLLNYTVLAQSSIFQYKDSYALSELNYMDNIETVKIQYLNQSETIVSNSINDSLYLFQYDRSVLKNTLKFPKPDYNNFFIDFCINEKKNKLFILYKSFILKYHIEQGKAYVEDTLHLNKTYYDLEISNNNIILINDYNRFNNTKSKTKFYYKIIEINNFRDINSGNIETDGIAFSMLGDKVYTINNEYLYVVNSLKDEIFRIQTTSPFEKTSFSGKKLNKSIDEIPFDTKLNKKNSAKKIIFNLNETFLKRKRNTGLYIMNDTSLIIVESHKEKFTLKKIELARNNVNLIKKVKFKPSYIFGKTGIIMLNSSQAPRIVNDKLMLSEIFLSKNKLTKLKIALFKIQQGKNFESMQKQIIGNYIYEINL